MRVAILRCENLPAFVEEDISDYDDLFDDDRLLIAAFETRGHNASSIIWTDRSIDWNEYDIAIVRSTWDYIDRYEEYFKVLSKIEVSPCKLFNPLKAIRWNSDKHYLLDLEKWGVPVVPTFKAGGSDLNALQDYFEEKCWNEAVLKPSVGAGGADVQRINSKKIFNEYKKLKIKLPDHKIIIQPLIDSVISEGELSYAYINGEFSHALLKKPHAQDYRTNVVYGGSIATIEPQKEDLIQADTILSKLPFDLLYARLDLVRTDGKLAVMEVELIEPVLYFNLAGKGADQMVSAAIDKLKNQTNLKSF